MSGKTCAVCGKSLTETEVRLNERSIGSRKRRTIYLCRGCRQKEYEIYRKSIQDILKKKE
jgi:ribosomal protein L37E